MLVNLHVLNVPCQSLCLARLAGTSWSAGRMYDKRYFNTTALNNVSMSSTEHFSAPSIITNIPFDKSQSLKETSSTTKTLTSAHVQVGTGNVDRPPDAGSTLLHSTQIETQPSLSPFPAKPTDVILKATVTTKDVDDALISHLQKCLEVAADPSPIRKLGFHRAPKSRNLILIPFRKCTCFKVHYLRKEFRKGTETPGFMNSANGNAGRGSRIGVLLDSPTTGLSTSNLAFTIKHQNFTTVLETPMQGKIAMDTSRVLSFSY